MAVNRTAFAFFFFASICAASEPLAAAECADLKRIATLDLTQLRSGRPAVHALVADKVLTLLVDTGGVYSQLSPRIVRELNLPTTTTLDRRSIRSITGDVSDRQVKLASIQIGTLRQEGAYFFVSPTPDDGDEARPREYDGIIGADFLVNFDADFDFAAGKLNLFSPDHCAGKTVYWTPKFLAKIPFSLDSGGHVNFRVELDGKRINAVLDTGATNTDLNLTVAERLFNVDVNAPDVERVAELQGGYTVPVYRRRFKTLALGGVVIENPDLLLLPDLVSGAGRRQPRLGSLITPKRALPDLLLGMPTLRQLHVYIAYKERNLYITEAGEKAVAPVP